MQLNINFPKFSRLLLVVGAIFACITMTKAEGSKDFWGYPGYRLFYNAEQQQQLKVYASAGEFINVGASHVGITGGFIVVYRPDGTVAARFDGSDNQTAIIHNHIEELNGPTGGGTTDSTGYIPGVIQVLPETEGIWTIELGFPEPTQGAFDNILNGMPWDRSVNQPLVQRVVLAWDVTVTQDAAGNESGNPVEGRVYSNEYISIQNGNNITTSPTFYILSRDGYIYQIDFNDTDPWGFPLFCNSFGVVTGNQQPTYASFSDSAFTRSADPNSWTADEFYLYDPQARDIGSLINNKIFFNPPDENMPTTATVTDIFNATTHTTWLFNPLSTAAPEISEVFFKGNIVGADNCDPLTSAVVGQGGFICFTANTSGTASVLLDLDGNGSYEDAIDRNLSAFVSAGKDSVFWDGRDGLGNVVAVNPALEFNYTIEPRSGEIHLLLLDVENNSGGFSFTRMNGLGSPDSSFYFDHSAVGGIVSGGEVAGNPQATTTPYTYENRFGDNLLLDFWTFIEFSENANGSFTIAIVENCSVENPIDSNIDTDGDGIADIIDLDDDNDGIPDMEEFCNANMDDDCSNNTINPSGDEDGDGILNYQDAMDMVVNNDCMDEDGDGYCDQILFIYDLDGDNIPDHLDLDADNDGITDLVEAGHGQADIDLNGIIDGDATSFGGNGLFNAIATHPDSLTASITYFILDKDKDEIADYKDLDSDNDGIHDVREGNFGVLDTNDDGRIDDGQGNIPSVTTQGIVLSIIPDTSNISIASPPDTDGDGVFDWRDLDSDNDGINDVLENKGTDLDADGFLGLGLPMVNGNGVATGSGSSATMTGSGASVVLLATSLLVDTDADLIGDFRDLDSDADGIFDVNEVNQPDSDSNGVIGMGTPTINRYGQATADATGTSLMMIEIPIDTDGDTIPDFQDIDRDGDGILDSYECPDGAPCIDTDGDSVPDVDDLDSDGDLLSDIEECPDGIPCPDTNGNDIDDFREFDCNEANKPVVAFEADTVISLCGFTTNIVLNRLDSLSIDTFNYEWIGPNAFTQTGQVTSIDDIGLTGIDTGGLYTLVVGTNQGCFADSISMTIALQDSLDMPLLSLSRNLACVGEDITLSVVLLENVPATYNWFFNNSDSSILLASTDTSVFVLDSIIEANTGDYSVRVNVLGCNAVTSDTLALVVEPRMDSIELIAVAISEDTMCTGSTITLEVMELDMDNVTIEWFGPQGRISTGRSLTIDSAGVEDSGPYFAVASVGNCNVMSNTIDIQINPTPATPNLVVSKNAFCVGETIELSIDAEEDESIQYQWFFSASDTTFATLLATTTATNFTIDNASIENSGSYSVFAISNICASQTSSAVDISIGESFEVAITSSLEADFPLCEGTTVVLNTNQIEDATYEWIGPAGVVGTTDSLTLDSVTTAQSGDYYVNVSVGGCTATSEAIAVNVANTAVTPTLSRLQTAFCSGDDITLTVTNPTEGAEYEWYVNGDGLRLLLDITEVPTFSINDAFEENTGNYSVVAVTDGCFSPISAEVSIQVYPSLEVEISSSAQSITPACAGDMVSFDAPVLEGVSYEWFGPNGLFSNLPNPQIDFATPEMSGRYFAVLTTGSGSSACTQMTEPIDVLINGIPEVPELSVSQNDLCSGETLQLNATSTTGSVVTYNWYFNNSDERELLTSTQEPTLIINTADVPNNGQYSVEVNVDGCASPPSNIQQISVEQLSGELRATSSATLASPGCEGDRVILSATNVEGATYEWFGPDGLVSRSRGFTLPNATLEDAGKYYAEVTLGGCTKRTNEIDVVVNTQPPVPFLQARTNSLCPGEQLDLATGAYSGINVSYNWYFNDGEGADVLITTTATPNFSFSDANNAVAGNYSVDVTVDGCTSARSNAQLIDIIANSDEIEVFTSISSGNAICEGERVSFFTTPLEDASYQWFGPNGPLSNQPSPTIFNATANQTGIYYAVVTFGDCSITTNEIELRITSKPDKPQIFVSNNLCSGRVLELSATSYEGDSVTYDWIFSDGKTETVLATTDVPTFPISNVSPSNSGFYSVRINVDGCNTAPSDVTRVEIQTPIENMLVTSSASIDNPACSGDAVNFTAPFIAGATYQWFGPNNFSSTLVNPTIPEATEESSGEYFAVITIDGCPNTTSSVMVEVKPKPERPFLSAQESQVCVAEEAVLRATNSPDAITNRAIFYQWFRESSNQLIGETQEGILRLPDVLLEDAGNYFVELNNEGCTSAPSNMVALEVDEAPEETAFILDESSNFCEVSEIVVEAVQPAIGTGQWIVPNSNADIINASNNVTTITNLDGGINTILWALSYRGCDNFSVDSIFVSTESTSVVAQNDEYTIDINQSLTAANILENDQMDGIPNIGVTITDRPAFGRAQVDENGQIEYIPNPNFFGFDEFVYEVCNTACTDVCDQAVVRINIVDEAQDIQCFAPNVITPNGDGLNDEFRIPCVTQMEDASELKVFNRWGDIVFETGDYQNEWAGTHNGNPLPPGTYFYLVRLGNDQTKCMQGYFQLLR